MNTSRTLTLITLAMVGQCFSDAAIAECFYGSDKYSDGTVLCQAGLRMQCQESEEGKPLWVSMEQQCSVLDPAIEGATTFKGSVDAESRTDQSQGHASAAASESANATGSLAEATGEADESSAVTPSGVSMSSDTTSAGNDSVIEILWATYGRDGHTCDAAPAVMQRCNGEAACELEISAETLCENSYPDRTKLLSVYWRCTNRDQSLMKGPTYGQDSQMTLQCDQESAP